MYHISILLLQFMIVFVEILPVGLMTLYIRFSHKAMKEKFVLDDYR